MLKDGALLKIVMSQGVIMGRCLGVRKDNPSFSFISALQMYKGPRKGLRGKMVREIAKGKGFRLEFYNVDDEREAARVGRIVEGIVEGTCHKASHIYLTRHGIGMYFIKPDWKRFIVDIGEHELPEELKV